MSVLGYGGAGGGGAGRWSHTIPPSLNRRSSITPLSFLSPVLVSHSICRITSRTLLTTASQSRTLPHRWLPITTPCANGRRRVGLFPAVVRRVFHRRLDCWVVLPTRRLGHRLGNIGGMPITGTGCNDHEMMVATEKRVISPMFLDSVRTLRFPKIGKIYTRLQEKQKQQDTRTPENSSLPIPLIVHNFNADGTTFSQSPWRSSGLSA